VGTGQLPSTTAGIDTADVDNSRQLWRDANTAARHAGLNFTPIPLALIIVVGAARRAKLAKIVSVENMYNVTVRTAEPLLDD
jgi:hypothetical protein